MPFGLPRHAMTKPYDRTAVFTVYFNEFWEGLQALFYLFNLTKPPMPV